MQPNISTSSVSLPAAFSTRGLLAAVLMALSGFALAGDKIGTVTTSNGQVSMTRNNTVSPAPVGTALEATDVLKTGEGANVSVAFADGTRVLLGPNSHLAMESYAYNPENKKGNMMFNISKGTMRMITGALNKANPGQAYLKTPSATAGIRGTDFIVDVASVN